MRKLVLAATSIALMAGMMTMATPNQARAATWCSKIGGATHCMYKTHAQCRASISGRPGTCVRRH